MSAPSIVRIEKGDVVKLFRTATEAALYMDVSQATLSLAISNGYSCVGWKVSREKQDGPLKIVGISPQGVPVLFDSPRCACDALHFFWREINTAIRMNTAIEGWRFAYQFSYKGEAPVSAEDYDFSGYRAGTRSNGVSLFEMIGDKPKDSREAIAVGYYDPDFGPCVCPICKKVLTTSDGNRIRHLSRCLKGYDFEMYHSAIRVFGKHGEQVSQSQS